MTKNIGGGGTGGVLPGGGAPHAPGPGIGSSRHANLPGLIGGAIPLPSAGAAADTSLEKPTVEPFSNRTDPAAVKDPGTENSPNTKETRDPGVRTTGGEFEIPGLPPFLRTQIDDLNKWHKCIRTEANWDTVKMWILKAPVIIAAACAALFTHLHLDLVDYIFAAVAGVCVAVDGFARPGNMRNVRLSAIYELGELMNEIKDRWEQECLEGKDQAAIAAGIIAYMREEKRRISKYLKSSQVAPENS